ncbi:oligosaccharide flippase family protein [Bradyrhizobium sp. WYCCWR 13022]|uniref:lipopolysaccharide biosynthesis protein n=1 Tax=unclassified Bradyrhizobium TaxID=2631580 RepID=UPI00263A807F|nr:oligosaccharide flippase family protein [Bradyrhizobium sp. WYCCWR 13022]MDN4988161.1 oligosaccharide flippase family protein [Bradyrhizobium sp. WYCCWR 13022]
MMTVLTMRIPRKLVALTNVLIRSATLGLRFLLSFYVIKYLGYDAAGVYGLTVGVTGITPALIGWGLNYFVAREVVGMSPSQAALRIRNRLFITIVSLTLATVAMILFSFFTQRTSAPLFVLIAILAWLETIALDLHLPLIGLGKAVEANVLVFIRSAAWVPFIVGLGLAFPQFRSMEALLSAWIVADVLALVLLGVMARQWGVGGIISSQIDFGWIVNRLRRSWHIYVSDVSLVGLMYLDRYIVGIFLGLSATGIYTFFWSLSNSLQTLVSTAVVQTALPTLVKAFSSEDRHAWKNAITIEFYKVISISVGMALVIFAASEVALHYMSMRGLSEHHGLFLLLLAASVLRACSDLGNVAMLSTQKDTSYAAINIIGVFLSTGMTCLGVALYGLSGAGVAIFTTAVILLLMRIWLLAGLLRPTASPDPGDHT